MTLKEFASSKGFDLPHIAPGQVARFDRGKEGNGWATGNQYYVTFGDWRTGEKHTWRSDNLDKLDPAEKLKVEQELKDAYEFAKRSKAEGQKKVSVEAGKLLTGAMLRTGHPYLDKKGFPRQMTTNHFDNLLVQMEDIHGKIWNVQRIHPDGTKRFLKGGKVKGCFYVIGNLDGESPIYLCEGFATGLSIDEGKRELKSAGATVVCFNSGNLLSVGKAIRDKYPNREIFVCADNDRNNPKNPGLKEGQKTAREIQGKLLYPTFNNGSDGATDFNDLHIQDGRPALEEQLQIIRTFRKEKTRGAFHPMKIGEFYENTDDEIKWLVDELLPATGVSLFAGREKVGKTTVVRQLVHSVLTQTPFLDRKITTSGSVLYVSLDEADVNIKVHFQKLGITSDMPLAIHTGMLSKHVADELDSLFSKLHQVKKPIPALTVLDTLVKCTHVNEINSYSDAVKCISPLQDIAYRWNTHILFTHHTGKAVDRERMDAVSGSTGITGCTDANIMIGRDRDDDGAERFIRSQLRVGKGWKEDMYFVYDDKTGRVQLDGSKKERKSRKKEARVLEMIGELPFDQHSKRAFEEMGINYSRDLIPVATRLAKDGRLTIHESKGSKGQVRKQFKLVDGSVDQRDSF